MGSWRECWRKGFVPVLTTDALEALAEAIREDDPRLIQGATMLPRFGDGLDYLDVEAGCVACFAAVTERGGFGLVSVGEADELFSRLCFEADQLLGGPAETRWFLNWFDDTPRDEMRRELLSEVELALSERARAAA